MNPILLDCTLRDGAYIVNGQFGEPAIRGIISKLEDSGAEIIECGWLKNEQYTAGSTYYHVPSDLTQYLTRKRKHVTYAVMIDWDRYDLDYLPSNDGNSIDAIRVVFPHGKYRQGVEVGTRIAEKGYRVFFQAANTLAYSEEELIDLAKFVNSVKPISLSVVDTFGAMYEEDLTRILEILDKHLSPEIALGFHSHNNQQLSFALSIHFISLFRNSVRQIIIDSSLCGMGRGAGNATTELTINYLNRKCDCHYDMDAIMDAIDIYMGYYQERYKWGYSTPYFIAGMYGCHVNNIAYLLNNHRTTAKDMRNIIESMTQEDRRKYDYDLLEQKYMSVMNRHIEDGHTAELIRNAFAGKELLLIAPGKSVISQHEKIMSYIEKSHALVLGVNAIVSDYKYDYVFYANPIRYEYAQTSAKDRFEASCRILLSNIKIKPSDKEYIFSYEHAIRRGWMHYDNAVICCLRLLDWLGIEHITIAGFDGFKNYYNESYADPLIPAINPEIGWEALNEEIRDMYQEFKKNAKSCHSIVFLTNSIFE